MVIEASDRDHSFLAGARCAVPVTAHLGTSRKPKSLMKRGSVGSFGLDEVDPDAPQGQHPNVTQLATENSTS
jgi:hypothetical protein